MTQPDRLKYLYENSLCFGCYKPTSPRHRGNTCTEKRVCSVCNERHPTGLHKSDERTSTLSTMPEVDEMVSMCVLPVRIAHIENPEVEVVVYAVLDHCSKGTFVREDVAAGIQAPILRPANLSVRAMIGEKTDPSSVIAGLTVRGTERHLQNYPASKILQLPIAYTYPEIPIEESEIATPSKLKPWKHLESIVEKIEDYDPSIPVGLMIGGNCARAHDPLETIPGVEEGPFAFRSQLGWCVVGALSKKHVGNGRDSVTSFRTIPIDLSTNTKTQHHLAVETEVKDNSIKDMLSKLYESETLDPADEEKSLSQEDRKFLSIVTSGTRLDEDNHYEVPLPFRGKEGTLPNNREYIKRRTLTLKQRFQRDKHFKDEYTKFMKDLTDQGYAQRCREPGGHAEESAWYLPHHSVHNPKKPDKFRVVLDCGAGYQGRNLNAELLQGPDMTNSLVGVFQRFRKEEVAFTADVKAMFYQVRIPKDQRRFVRFLWWPDGDTSKELCDYEMCVHPFGAVSSPGCANFALRQTAADNKERFGSAAHETITQDFYVDDCAKSEPSSQVALNTARDTEQCCQAGGFNLTKFISNSPEVNNGFASEKRLNPFEEESATKVRVLGMPWNVEDDTLDVGIKLVDNKPLTRRGMLSYLYTHWELSGVTCPFMMEGKKIMQEAAAVDKVGWDEPVSEVLVERWRKWKDGLVHLENLTVARCFKPPGFGPVRKSQLHVFSDASEYGYGACSYLRQVNIQGNIHVSFVMAKSRVTPLKPSTIPRLELTAATVASQLGTMLLKELKIPDLAMRYWVDSKIVLGYILNETRRFRVFVGNRVQKIRTQTNPADWAYTDTKNNPADDISRGLSWRDTAKIKRYMEGPAMLREKEETWEESREPEVQADDEEVRQVKVYKTSVKESWVLPQLESHCSKWSKYRRTAGWVRRFLHNFLVKWKPEKGLQFRKGDLSVVEVQDAELAVLRVVQAEWFQVEIDQLQKGVALKKGGVTDLDPFLDEKGVLRVGGRLRREMVVSVGEKFPIILPKKSQTSRLIVEWCHQKVEHAGRTSTHNEVRSRGYWVSSNLVKKVVFESVRRRAMKGKYGEQKMADLPIERLEVDAPFTYCGVDIFGPFLVKEGRKELKRYGALFTCFASRAVHIETTCTLETDSFLLALRRFIARRGPVRSIRSDNGTNFVGADNELTRAFKEMDHERLGAALGEMGCDWMITWKRNPPTASHMGGVWERQIRSVRDILQSLLKTNGHLLNDESLRTLLLEAEAIVNSRPLTVDSLSDPTCLPLSPAQVLTMKSKVVLPPPGVFEEADLYCRKRWRRVQHLANEFWQRWRKEYLASLQARQKWGKVRRNFCVNDIVLLKDDSATRNHWPMGRVEKVAADDGGLVRSVQLRVAYSKDLVSRPISKIVLLVEASI